MFCPCHPTGLAVRRGPRARRPCVFLPGSDTDGSAWNHIISAPSFICRSLNVSPGPGVTGNMITKGKTKNIVFRIPDSRKLFGLGGLPAWLLSSEQEIPNVQAGAHPLYSVYSASASLSHSLPLALKNSWKSSPAFLIWLSSPLSSGRHQHEQRGRDGTFIWWEHGDPGFGQGNSIPVSFPAMLL